MPVSPASAAMLREAMARLLAGDPLHTDGALTKENLAREARVSHATVEWEARVARQVRRSVGEVSRDEAIEKLRAAFRESKAQVMPIGAAVALRAVVRDQLGDPRPDRGGDSEGVGVGVTVCREPARRPRRPR